MQVWQKDFVKDTVRQFYLKTVGWETRAVTPCQKILIVYLMIQAEQ